MKLTRNSQLELANHIESLNETLISVLALNGDHPELDAYLEKLANAQKKLAHVTSSVNSSHDRLIKVGKMINKEAANKQRIQNSSRSNLTPAMS